MAFMIPVAQAVGSFVMSNAMTIASLAATGISAIGSMNAAAAQQQAAYDTAAGIDQRAGQERAIAHREMARQQRENKAALSEQKTQLAATGFAADDPSRLRIVGATEDVRTGLEMLIKAQAEESARGMESEARQMRSQAKSDYKAARAQTLSSLAGDLVSWRDRYGNSRSSGGGSTRTTTTPKPRVKTG